MLQNLMLVMASYFFYGYWDWRFLSLILISTLVDYISGQKIYASFQQDSTASLLRRKRWLFFSIGTNLGLLGVFKYYNFFIDSLTYALSSLDLNLNMLRLDIILPVGISFYTFQTMSYTIDIYRQKLQPTGKFLDFALFVSFFPQLVAGPVERASVLLPQMSNHRKFDKIQFLDGLHLIFWGMFKKVYVADNLAGHVDKIFKNPSPSSFEVLVGTYSFAVQIYCDFSGYSDIARGLAKCLGMEFRLNFDHPFFAVNPGDFWRRWHISLSSWLRDYLYISLGGNRGGKYKTYQNLSLTMLLGGLWHGAAWNFVIWGAYQGFLLISHRLLEPILKTILPANVIESSISNPPSLIKTNSWAIQFIHWVKIAIFFQLVCYGWLLFRAQSMQQIISLTGSLVQFNGPLDTTLLKPLLIFATPLIGIDFLQYVAKTDNLQRIPWLPSGVKVVFYSIFFYLLAFHGAGAQSFIYFQF